MRISDWSSDVCSSDLSWNLRGDELWNRCRSPRGHRYRECRRPAENRGLGRRIEDAGREPSGADLCRHGSGRADRKSTPELQSLMRISYAVFCLKKKTITSETTSSR